MLRCFRETSGVYPYVFQLTRPFTIRGHSLPVGSRSVSRGQLMKHPHGRWIQRSESMNTGVTAGASRVRKKLTVPTASRDGLCSFTA